MLHSMHFFICNFVAYVSVAWYNCIFDHFDMTKEQYGDKQIQCIFFYICIVYYMILMCVWEI